MTDKTPRKPKTYTKDERILRAGKHLEAMWRELDHAEVSDGVETFTDVRALVMEAKARQLEAQAKALREGAKLQ